MASPLGWFRRHQTGMLVVFGVVLMGIFGLGTVFTMITPDQLSNSYGKETAVSWSGGNISKLKLENTRFRHFQTLSFLEELQRAGIEKLGNEFRYGIPRDLMIRPVAPARGNVNPEMIDAAIMQRMLFAKAAEEQGVRVNDTMVNDYFSRLSGVAGFNERDLEAINRNANGDRVELVEIRNQMKMELAAQQYQIMMFTGLPTMANPTEAAKSFTQLNQQIECSTYPVKVADFVSEVDEEPSVADLKKLFKEGQYQLADQTMQRPGFKVGNRLKVQYLYAEPSVFMENEMRTVSDAEVQEKYDELVAAEDDSVMELIPPEATETPEDEGTDPDSDDPAPQLGLESSDPGMGQGELDPAPTPEVDPAPAVEIDPAPAVEIDPAPAVEIDPAPAVGVDPAPPIGVDPAPAVGVDPAPAVEVAPATGVGAPTEGGIIEVAPIVPAPTDGTSVFPKSDRFVFTSLRQEDAAVEQQIENVIESTTQTADKVVEQVEQTEEAETIISDLKKRVEPTTPVFGDSKQAESTTTPDKTLDPMLDEEEQDEEQTPILMRPKTLDENLARVIRENMVAADALSKMKDAVATAQAEVQDKQFLFIEWEGLTDKEKKSADKPEGLDIEELAKTLGLQHGETELLTVGGLIQDDFGKKLGQVTTTDRFGRPSRSQQLFGVIIAQRLDKLTLYESDVIVESSLPKNSYVWWLTDKKDTLVRDFADAKDDVREYWRYQRARELAKAKADKIAKELNSGNTLLMESNYAKDDQVTNTGGFTWYSNSGFARPENVDNPGDEFMGEAFGLELNKAGAAFNDSKQIAYVVQKISNPKKSEEEHAEDFLTDWSKFQRISGPVSGLTERRNQEMQMKEMERIAEKHEINWVSQ